jgi:hypothetical protein
MQINTEYEILNNSGTFVDFLGVEKTSKKKGIKVTLENDMNIVVSEDHIFISSSIDMYAKDLVPNVAYLTTTEGDYYVRSVEKVDECDFYDIVDSEDCEYFANGILNHNCSFLGSGDNFIAEEFLKRILDSEVLTPLRQEYLDKNMWIFEDAIAGEDYIMAIDASPGHGEDSSTLNMLKTIEVIEDKVVTKNGKSKKIKIRRHKVEQVAEYYGKVTPQMLSEIAYQFGKAYNDAYCVVDITGGYGVQTVEKLLEIGYENIHYSEVNHKPSRDRLQGYIKRGQKVMSDGKIMEVDLIPGFFIGNNRPSLLLEMQRAIHLGEVVIRSTRLLNELKTFVTVAGNRVADHKRSFHDDSIMGLAIGLYTLNFTMSLFKQNKTVTEKLLNAILSSNDIADREKENKLNDKMNTKPVNTLNSPENPYGVNSWLFTGLKGR